MRFTIKSTASRAQTESDGSIVRFSGASEPYRQASERSVRKIGEDDKGKGVFSFVTGLDEDLVNYYAWFSDEEKKFVKKQIKELKPEIVKYYGGESITKDSNFYFWKTREDIGTLILSNNTLDLYYDTKNPEHALKYLSIISGAFSDVVAPNREWADRYTIPHYLALESEETFDEDDTINRSDAHAELAALRKGDGVEALLILTWCLQYDTVGFGAVSRATPMRELVSYLSQYIDGKLVSKRKKDTAKNFILYAERWSKPQTKQLLYAEAYVKAGVYFAYILKKEKNFETQDGTALGNTIEEAVDNLMKPKFQEDLEKLREKVETKWKE